MSHSIQIYTQGQMNHAQADAYRKGFKAAKAAAIAAIDDTPAVYPRDTREAQLGDAEATKSLILHVVSSIKPESSQ